MKIRLLLLILAITSTSFSIIAQVAINTDGTSANSSAMLDVKSTTKGLLPPRMTEAERDAINPGADAAGLIIYQTDETKGLWYFDGANWVQLGPVSSETDPSVPTGTETGQMQYWNSSAWVVVPAGTSGQLLFVNSSGIPEWQNPSFLKSAATREPTIYTEGIIFNGMVNVNGLSTTVYFEYGRTKSYGTIVPASQSPVSGTTNTVVSSDSRIIYTGGEYYHVRLVTQNIFGTFYGDDITFKSFF